MILMLEVLLALHLANILNSKTNHYIRLKRVMANHDILAKCFIVVSGG